MVVSPDEANSALRTVIVAPLTSVRRPWPARVPVKVARAAGDAALDQMRVDKARLAWGGWGRCLWRERHLWPSAPHQACFNQLLTSGDDQ